MFFFYEKQSRCVEGFMFFLAYVIADVISMGLDKIVRSLFANHIKVEL